MSGILTLSFESNAQCVVFTSPTSGTIVSPGETITVTGNVISPSSYGHYVTIYFGTTNCEIGEMVSGSSCSSASSGGFSVNITIPNYVATNCIYRIYGSIGGNCDPKEPDHPCACNGNGASIELVITCDGAPPYQLQAPNLISPINFEDRVRNPAYHTWGDVQNAEFYEIQVDPSPNFDTIVLQDSLGKPYYVPIFRTTIDRTQTEFIDFAPDWENTTFYWRVRAGSCDCKVWGPWSETWSYTTAPCISLELPLNGTIFQSGEITLVEGRIVEPLLWGKEVSVWLNGPYYYPPDPQYPPSEIGHGCSSLNDGSFSLEITLLSDPGDGIARSLVDGGWTLTPYVLSNDDCIGDEYYCGGVSQGIFYIYNDLPLTRIQEQIGRNTSSIYVDDPVDIITGNFLYSANDIHIPDKLGINLTRNYNSQNIQNSELGAGWSFTFGASLQLVDDWRIIARGDGRRFVFKMDSLGTYIPMEFAGTEGTLDSATTVWTYTSKYGYKYDFDNTGLLQSLSDRNGNETRCFYKTHNMIDSLVIPGDRRITFSYLTSPDTLIESITDFIGRTHRYAYDTESNLISYINPRGDTTKYEYDTQHHLTKIIDPRGNVFIQNNYDPKGRVIEQYDAFGARTEFVYDTLGMSTYVVNYLGDTTTYVYDQHHRILSQTTALGYSESYAYDSTNNRASIDDMNDELFSYPEYSPFGDVAREENPVSQVRTFSYDSTTGDLLARGDDLGTLEERSYSTNGLLLQLTDANGSATNMTYDGYGYLESTSMVADGASRTTEYDYDIAGRMLSRKNPEGDVTDYQYDESDNVTSTLFANGASTQNEYDANDNLIKSIDRNGNETRFEYDVNNNLRFVYAPESKTTEYRYDSLNRVTSMIDAEGGVYAYQYDAMGRKTLSIDPIGRTTHMGYDGNGNMLFSTSPKGDTTQFIYNAINQLVEKVSPEGNTTSYSYDVRGSLTQISYPSGNTIEYTYDGNGNQTSKKEYLDSTTTRTTTYTYNEANQLVETTYPSGGKEKRTYDRNGNLIELVTIDGKTTAYEYNEMNRVSKETDYRQFSQAYQYDNNLNLLSETDDLGRRTAYAYDKVNRQVSTTDPIGNTDSLVYDKLDRVVQMIDANGNATVYGYDAAGQLTSVTDPLGNSMSYQYDLNGNLSQITYGNGRVVSGFIYDKDNRLLNEPDPPTWYTYDPNGNIASKVDANGDTTSYEYDGANQLLRKTFSSGGSVQYSYNANGLVESIEDEQGLIRMQHNAANQLLELATPDGIIQYQYAGPNRVSMKYPNDELLKYSYDRNRLTTIEGTRDAISYTYYDNGLIESLTYPDSSVTYYAYDEANQLETILSETSDGELITSDAYKYDEAGNRVINIRTRRRNPGFVGVLVDSTLPMTALLAKHFFDSPVDTILICSNRGFAHNATIAAYASKLNAPVLYVNPNTLVGSPEFTTVFSDLTAGFSAPHAIVFGDETTVSDYVVSQLHRLGCTTVRIFGNNRFETANLVASKLPVYSGQRKAFLTGSSNPEDLAISAYASALLGIPQYMTYNDELAPETLAALQSAGIDSIIVVGNSISDAVLQQLISNGIVVVQRFDQDNIRERSAAILTNSGTNLAEKGPLYLCESKNFREAIAISTYVANRSGYVICVDDPADYLATVSDMISIGTEVDSIFLLQTNPFVDQQAIQIQQTFFGYEVDTVRYTYDDMNQLLAESSKTFGVMQYTYDANYNRSRLVDNGVATDYAYDTWDRLISAGTTAMNYDGNGNLITETDADKTSQYVWDSRGRLAEYNNSLGDTARYTYDALNHRIRISNIHSEASPETTSLVYGDDWDAILEFGTAEDSINYLSGFGIDDVYLSRSEQVSFLYKDALGSIVSASSDESQSFSSLMYDGFGNANRNLSVFPLRYSYTGREYDSPLKGYYYRNRTYSARRGRFLSMDPIDPQKWYSSSLNKYIYVKNNPVRCIDPNGYYGIAVNFNASIAYYVGLDFDVTIGYDDKIGLYNSNDVGLLIGMGLDGNASLDIVTEDKVLTRHGVIVKIPISADLEVVKVISATLLGLEYRVGSDEISINPDVAFANVHGGSKINFSLKELQLPDAYPKFGLRGGVGAALKIASISYRSENTIDISWITPHIYNAKRMLDEIILR